MWLDFCIHIEYTIDMPRNIIATIRLTKEEASAVKAYLRHNPVFESVSSLGRVATMEFIRSRRELPLSALPGTSSEPRPAFLWDYDLTEFQVHELLRHAPFDQRKWLIARILDRLRPPEVFRYLTLEDIRQALPRLRLEPRVKRHWQEAVALWTRAPATS